MPNSIKKMLGYKIQNLYRFENIFMLDVTSERKLLNSKILERDFRFKSSKPDFTRRFIKNAFSHL